MVNNDEGIWTKAERSRIYARTASAAQVGWFVHTDGGDKQGAESLKDVKQQNSGLTWHLKADLCSAERPIKE